MVRVVLCATITLPRFTDQPASTAGNVGSSQLAANRIPASSTHSERQYVIESGSLVCDEMVIGTPNQCHPGRVGARPLTVSRAACLRGAGVRCLGPRRPLLWLPDGLGAGVSPDAILTPFCDPVPSGVGAANLYGLGCGVASGPGCPARGSGAIGSGSGVLLVPPPVPLAALGVHLCGPRRGCTAFPFSCSPCTLTPSGPPVRAPVGPDGLGSPSCSLTPPSCWA